jgi:steroid 5-alpha reductase family enzyme
MLKAAAIIGGFNLGGFLLTTGIKSEVVTDLLGTGSIGLSALALASSASSPRLVVACTAIGVWSLRLSSFLAYRAFLNGDARFKPFFPPVVDGKKGNWADYPDRLGKLAGFWGLQALWGFVMLCPLLLRHTSVPVWYGWPGIALAAVGFAIEAVADQQKFNYKNNSNELMTSGLFSVVRYPQYSGIIFKSYFYQT